VVLLLRELQGNTGIGLGLLGNSLGYKTIIVMNDNQTQEKKDTLRNLGAELKTSSS
jgi:cysteine synthase A